MAYDGIIFDFNGTLFFDSDKQEQAWHTVSRQLRGKGFTSEEMYERVHGRSSRSIFEYLLRKPLTQEQVWELIERKETIYRELCLQDEERFRLAPGAAELLDWLCEHGIPHTIATASEIRNVRFFREHFGLDRWFDPRRIVYDDGTFSGKPAPDIYLRAAERIGLSPSRCIVAEDARSGIEAARRAGRRHDRRRRLDDGPRDGRPDRRRGRRDRPLRPTRPESVRSISESIVPSEKTSSRPENAAESACKSVLFSLFCG